MLQETGDLRRKLRDNAAHFRASMSGTIDLDFDKVEAEVAEVARGMVAEHRDIRGTQPVPDIREMS